MRDQIRRHVADAGIFVCGDIGQLQHKVLSKGHSRGPVFDVSPVWHGRQT